MNPTNPSNPSNSPEAEPPPAEVQQGTEHGIAHDEQLKRIVRQHPERDEPKVDSVEPREVPPGR